MRLKFFAFSIVVLAAALAPSVACAENLTIHTQFPSPYGTYGTVSTTGDADFATRTGDVQVASTGAGGISIGEPCCDTAFLTVIGNIGGQHTASFRRGDGWGVEAGGYVGGFGGVATAGSVQANAAAGGAGLLTLNPNETNVGVGITAPAYTLHVNGTIGIMRGGNTGALRVSRAADGNYYGHYAP